MKFGYFDDQNKEYVITTPQTPLPWINYLGSEDFFSLVSNTAGGYSFYRDARMRRLTRYRYNNSPLDMDGHRIYIKDGETVWNPGWQPTKTPLDSYSCRHGLGYTVVEGKKDGVTARQELFVPKGDACELDRLTLTNRSDRPRELDVFGYVEFCLWDAVDDSSNFQRNYSTGEVEVEGSVIYHKTEYRERRNHYAVFSPDYKYLVDVYSKTDVPPVTELRSAVDGKLLKTLETADISKLKANGWVAPEIFKAKGRDGKTDMWGLIYRPTNFDPSKTYPIIEYIYAGPGDAYVPKSFTPFFWNATALAELGFIVVQVDGMGTSYRGKKFEEICYKNLKDAGLPDHIQWIKAAAAKYPYMDANNVGIYGMSAGGQESTTALLFHGDFYKCAYSSCGCHDNRMDKIWWNEQWMGWPVDSSYVECSNVYNAHKLERPLMLAVGEIDNNVDPASTYQVVNALEKAGKDFDLIVIPGARHTMGEAFGEHKRFDFFVKHLYKVDPPKWSDLK